MSKSDAIDLLKADHRRVKDLYDDFKDATGKASRAKIANEAMLELKIHTEIEEKLFYPTVRRALVAAIGKADATDMMNEADEEHHVCKLLIAELETLDPGSDHWDAKFTVLCENVLHHVKEEEGEMFPQARKLDLDLEALGHEMMERKQELKANGVPPFIEEALIAKHGVADSPAETARTFA